MYTPEEIQAIFEEYNDAIRTGTPISKELAMAMKNASIGIKGASQELIKGFSQLGRSVTDYGAAMYKGEQGFKAFSKSIDDVEDAVDTFADILIGALAFLNPLAAAGIFLTKTLVKGAIDYSKAAGEMSDKLYDAYQGLSRVGSAGQQGMSGVFTSMQQFAYGLDELDKLIALIKENSKDLAFFSGTVLDGTQVLADTAESIQRSGLQGQLLAMGMSVDDINRGIAGYYNQIGRLGQLQGKTQADLTKGAYDYLVEMEGLTRLTGQERRELEKQREEANMIDQFLAMVQKMGPAGEELYKAFNILSAETPNAAKAMAASITGFITDESTQLFQATGGQLVELNRLLTDQKITAAQYANAIGRAVGSTIDLQQNFATLAGSGKEVFGPYYENVKLANMATKDWNKAIGQTKPIDGLTQSSVELRQRQMNTRDAMQDFVRLGVNPATEALNGLAGAAKSASGGLPGGGGKSPIGGGGSGGGWLRDLLGLGPAKTTGMTGVNADLATAVQRAVDEYKQLTGKTATITSGARSYEEQKKLYDDWVAGGKKGYPVAPPGSSRHEHGGAVDISAADVNAMDQMGLLKKYGLVRPVANDPVHVELAGGRSGYNQTVNAKLPGEMTVANSSDRYNQMVNNNNSDEMDANQQIIDLLIEQNKVLQAQLSVQEKTRQAVS